MRQLFRRRERVHALRRESGTPRLSDGKNPSFEVINQGQESLMNNLVRAIVPVIIGVGLWAAPVPTGLDHGAWIYFALFVAVVAGRRRRISPSSFS
jgi:hypothetical protein